MRIAVVDKGRCKPTNCGYICQRFCPMVRTGKETVVIDEESKKPVIVEDMCSGCGICVKKCPYGAIHIINLPEEVGEPIHQYGKNGFRLYNLPVPKEGVVGLVGANGIGKTTALKILSGDLAPNLGCSASWDAVLERFRGKEIQSYLEKLSRREIKASYKPQHVDKIPQAVSGRVRDLLEKADATGRMNDLAARLDIRHCLDSDVKTLSGGELQRVAIVASLVRDADIYFLDEPSSYLDVRERMNVAHAVRDIAAETRKYVMVIEHDLIVLDYLSDYIHVLFGTPGAYGIISGVKGTRMGINEYLSGSLKAENMRFREGIRFEARPPRDRKKAKAHIEYPDLAKDFGRFKLTVDAGRIDVPTVLGILGKNAIGKTTFVKMLAGVEKPDGAKLDLKLTVSYKPQYIEPKDAVPSAMGLDYDLVQRFDAKYLLDKNLMEMSGGELQRVAIVDCLSRNAEVYLLDEPSAYLDVEERLRLGKQLRKFAEDKDVSVLVVDHDILLVDYLSDELMVFTGEGGKSGHASKPMEMREGMNLFLKGMDATFRRDEETKRPRVNKPGSVKDREQRSAGEYYYQG